MKTGICYLLLGAADFSWLDGLVELPQINQALTKNDGNTFKITTVVGRIGGKTITKVSR